MTTAAGELGGMNSTKAADRLSDPIRSSLRSSVIDASAFSVMVGLGETYLPAFVLAVGLGEVVAGLMATVPMLTGSILQMISPIVLKRTGSRRRWVILCASTQALAFVPLCVGAWQGWIPGWCVLITATLYWAGALAAAPAWNTWMSHLVPPRIRTHFFSRRTRFAQFFVMLGLIVGGVILHNTKSIGVPLLGFAIVFAVACLSRLVSSYYLYKQVEPSSEDFIERRVRLGEMVDRFRSRRGALLVYMASVQIASQLAAPYFTPFMLEKLHFSYGMYVGMLAVSYFARSVALVFLGRFAKRYGAIRLLWFGGVGLVPLAVMCVVSDSPVYLLSTQVVAGVCWATYELATFLLLFETIPNDERTSVLTTFNLVNSTAIVTGSLLGGALLRWFDASYSAYMWLFAISSIARAAIIPLLRRVSLEPGVVLQVAPQILTVRPSGGSVDRPILSSIDDLQSRDRLSQSQLSLLSSSKDASEE